MKLTSLVILAVAMGCSVRTDVDLPPPALAPASQQPSPVFAGATTQASSAPLPISGGTLLATPPVNGATLIFAADPDEDAINVVTVGESLENPTGAPTLVTTVALEPGDEPGRMVADAAGGVHVVLRGGGGIADIVPTATGASLAMRRAICSAPRGIAYDATSDSLYVACATGEIARLQASGGPVTAMVDLDLALSAPGTGGGRDLRDIVVGTTNLYVTQFRSAQVRVLDKATLLYLGSVPFPLLAGDVSADVAWRAVPSPTGFQVVYQFASTHPINVATPPPPPADTPPPPPPPPAYGGGGGGGGGGSNGNGGQTITGGVVSAAVAQFADGKVGFAGTLALTTNPVVDVAIAPDGTFETVSVTGVVETTSTVTNEITPFSIDSAGTATSAAPNTYVAIADAVTTTNSFIVVQRRGPEPALVFIEGMTSAVVLPLPHKVSHADTGFDIFHVPTPATIACMSCHPEGGDDGHTWSFQVSDDSSGGTQIRRTQSLRGGIIVNAAPFHWDGSLPNVQSLTAEIYTHRMGGGTVTPAQNAVLTHFLSSMPRVPVKSTLDPSKIALGQAFFQGTGGCAGCHDVGTGTRPVTTNQDVGKLDAFGDTPLQVPMLLGVADRAPYMHDGCASTLADRFALGPCAGVSHGNITAMTETDIANVIEYLQSL